MRTKQGSILQSLRGVRRFLDANAARLADIVKTGAYKKYRLPPAREREPAASS